MTIDACPNRQRLQACVAGELTDTEAAEIFEHADRCQVCETAIEKIESHGNELIVGLQSASDTVDSAIGANGELDRAAKDGFGPSGETANEPAVKAVEQRGTAAVSSSVAAGKSSREIGPYRLLESIGEGGMGTVWLAEQERPVRRRVALKLIKAGQDSKQVIARFEAERQALAMMDHPNIAKVLDAGTTDDGSPYFVMELVCGIPITKYCDTHRLSPRARLELFLAVCSAVQHAHQKGIIHRDLKPSNVLVSEDDGKPTVKVIDFGLAKALQEEVKLTEKTMATQFGQIVGTPQYMSPEQAELDSPDIDTRSDVYSLGVILYELLTGTTPLEKEVLSKHTLLQILKTIRTREPARPSARIASSFHAARPVCDNRNLEPKKLQQMLRGDLDWIAIKSLAVDRTRRYGTANGLANDIRRFLENEPITARPPSTVYRLQKAVQKHRAAFSTAVAIFLLLLAGIATTSWQWHRAVRAEREAAGDRALAVRRANLAQVAQGEAERQRNETKKALYDVLISQAAATRLARQPGYGAEVRQLVAQAMALESENCDITRLRQEIVNCLGDPVALEPVALNRESPVRCIAAHPSSRRFALGALDGTISIHDLDDGRETDQFNAELGPVVYLAYRAAVGKDGKDFLVACHYNDAQGRWSIRRWWATEDNDHHNNEIILEFPLKRRFAVNRDLTYCALYADSELSIFDLREGVAVRKTELQGNLAGEPSLNADGSLMAAGCPKRHVHVWDTLTGQERAVLDPESGRTWGAYFSPDGGTLVAATEHGVIAYDAATLARLSYLRGDYLFGGSRQMIAFRGDGQFLAFPSHQIKSLRLWNLETNHIERTLPNSGNNYTALAFSTDYRKVIASAGNKVRIWNLYPQRERIHLSHPKIGVPDVAFDRHDHLLATIGKDGLARTLDPRSGAPIREYSGLPSSGQCLALSADRKFLAAGADSRSGIIAVWDRASGEQIGSLTTGWPNIVNAVAFSPNNDMFAACGRGGVKVWKWPPTGAANDDGVIDMEELLSIEFLQAGFLCFSCDGRRIAVAARTKDLRVEVHVWDLAEMVELAVIPNGPVNIIESLSFLRDGKQLVFINQNYEAEIWDAEHPTRIFRFPVAASKPGRATGHIAVPSTGNEMAVALENKVSLWDITTGNIILTISCDATPWCLDWSPDGKLLAAGLSDGATIWNIAAMKSTLRGLNLDW